MNFKYTGNDAAGNRVEGNVEAGSREEAAEIVRRQHKVYVRSMEETAPSRSADTPENRRKEAMRLVREQADKMDRMEMSDSKPYVYKPKGDHAMIDAEPQMGQQVAKHAEAVKAAPPRPAPAPAPIPFADKEIMEGEISPKQYGWEIKLDNCLAAIDKVVEHVSKHKWGPNSLDTWNAVDLVEFRKELTKTALTAAMKAASDSISA